jgi:hypothetical protein
MKDNDDLDDLLAPRDSTATPELRDRLRQMTSEQVRLTAQTRRQSYRKWLFAAAAMGACFVAGGATGWSIRPSTPPVIVVQRDPGEQKPDNRSSDSREPVPQPQTTQSPHDLEIAAELADGAESARLYLAAGRRYGSDLNDWQAALRCYRNALDLQTATPVVDPKNDDWLLVKLKTDRRENHANP